jgi:hypothetical protein
VVEFPFFKEVGERGRRAVQPALLHETEPIVHALFGQRWPTADRIFAEKGRR